MIRTKRIYDESATSDGYRLLVMRIWPRGVRRSAVEAWEKDLAPSLELLRAYRTNAITWRQFAARYGAEMRAHPEALAALSKRARRRTVTILCGCVDEAGCHRRLLKELVEG